MQTIPRREAMCVAALPLLLVLVTAPAHAQVADDLQIGGGANCVTLAGSLATIISWSADNQTASPITITSATMSGAVTGNLTFSPNPVLAAQGSNAMTVGLPASTSGVVTLTVNWTSTGGPGVSSGTVSVTPCVNSPTTSLVSSSTTSTPTTTIRQSTRSSSVAVAAIPTFTG